jgi:DNA primase
MPGIDYHRLRQQITMREVLDLIGFRATWRRGSQRRGPCPIPGCQSNSNHPFSVHLARQCYHCFACHSHGNPLDLWAAVGCLPLHQAAVDLCRRAHLPLPQLGSSLTPTLRQTRRVPSRAPSRNH